MCVAAVFGGAALLIDVGWWMVVGWVVVVCVCVAVGRQGPGACCRAPLPKAGGNSAWARASSSSGRVRRPAGKSDEEPTSCLRPAVYAQTGNTEG